MAELINEKESLNSGRKKLNEAIKDSNKALTDSQKALLKSIESMDLSEQTQLELTQAILNGDSSPLGGQLSVGADSTVYDGPQERLIAEHEKTTQQLAEEVQERNLDVLELNNNKASKIYTDNQLSTKRDKLTKIKSSDLDTSTDENKIKPINVSDELMEMFSPGGTVSPVIEDKSLTTEKYADTSIKANTLDFGIMSKVSDVFIKDPLFWTSQEQKTVVGSDGGYAENKDNERSFMTEVKAGNYIFSERIGVKGGETLALVFTGNLWRVSFSEFSGGELISDSGFQTDDTQIKLDSTTDEVRFLAQPVSRDSFFVDEIVNSNIYVYLDNTPTKDYKKEVTKKEIKESSIYGKNLLDVEWEQGRYLGSIGGVHSKDAITSRIRTKNKINAIPNMYYSVTNNSNGKYGLLIMQLDVNGVVLSHLLNNYESFTLKTTPQTEHFFIMATKKDNASITVNEAKNLTIIFEVGKEPSTFGEITSKNIDLNLSNLYKVSMFPTVKTRYFAHRGLSNEAPENTVESLELAGSKGYEGSEFDIRITSDERMVVMHDTSVDRTTDGTGLVGDLTYDYIRSLKITEGSNVVDYPNAKVPNLEEMLMSSRKYGIYPVIHNEVTRTNEQVEYFVNVLSEHGFLDRVVIVSSKIDVLNMLRLRMPNAHLQYLNTLTLENVDVVKKLGNSALSFNVDDDYDESFITYAQENNVMIGCYVVNDEEKRDALIEQGVDFVTTDGMELY